MATKNYSENSIYPIESKTGDNPTPAEQALSDGHDSLNAARTVRRALGAQLREARKAKGLTLAEMETLTGIDDGNISRIEFGRRNTGIDTYTRLGGVLGLEVTFKDKEL